MTTYAGGCAVSMTLTPIGGGAVVFAGDCEAGVDLTLKIFGAWFPSYTDEKGIKKPVEVHEFYKGRDISQGAGSISYSRVFLVHGTFETTKCLDLGPQVGDLDDVIPDMYVATRKLSWYGQGGGYSDMVKISIDYAQPDEPQSSGGDTEGTLTYEFTSETEHVDLALSQTHFGVQPEAAEDLLINFDGENVEGIEIDSPILSFTEEHRFTESQFTPAFRNQLTAAVKKTNAATWRTFEPESVLFDGASASKRNKTWYVSFRFRARLGFVNKLFTIVNAAGANEVVQVTKPGWHYFWVMMAKRSTDNNTKFQTAPASIHVAKVYDTLDFSTLSIGVMPLP